MKKIILSAAALLVAAGVSYAGCGKKVETAGNLTKFDAETKALTVEGAKKPITLQATTEVKNKAGEKVEIDTLVGKKVKVVAEHDKADSVQES